MKTIEERADAYVGHPEEIDEFTSATIKRDAYIRGAKEQKTIDEEVRLKKCDDMTEAEYKRETAFMDWYLENGKGTPAFSDAIEWARKETIGEACEWLKNNWREYVNQDRDGMILFGHWESNFRKAMEK